MSLALAGRFFNTKPPGKPRNSLICQIQAGSISHSLGRESRSSEDSPEKDPDWGAWKSRGGARAEPQEERQGNLSVGPSSCLLLPSPLLLPHPCWQGKWPWWPGQERCQRERWQRWEKGLVDYKLSIMAQIISILRRALCTLPRKSNTLKG